MAKKFGMSLKSAHAHTNIELSESLIPSGIVEHAGTVPTTRGPRILQLSGIPCFHLSLLGTLVASCIEEVGIEKGYFSCDGTSILTGSGNKTQGKTNY